jgi:O-antigen/teichoic acid export membrane protein
MGPSIRQIFNRFDPRRRSDLFKRSFKNAAWSSADYAVLPLLWLVATPFFVHKLGVDQYGIWMLANAFLGFSGIFAFGLSDATIKFVSKYRALHDEVGVVRVVRSTLTLYGVLGILAVTLVYFISPFLVNRVFNVQHQNIKLAIASLQIGGVGILVRFIDNVFLAIFQGHERYDLAAKVTAPSNVIMIVLAVLCAAMGLGLLAILWTTVLTLAISAAVKAIVVRRVLIPGVLFFPILSKHAIREIFGFGFYSWLQSVGGILLAQADRLIIASLLSTSALTYYAVCLQLARQIHAPLARAVGFLFPLASVARESGEIETMRSVYFKSLRFVTMCAVGIGLPIFVFSENILTLWMGADFASHAAGILRILTLSFAILATSIVPYYYLNGAGYVKLNTLFGLISGGIVAVATVLLVPFVGLVGAAWARLFNTPTGIVSRTFVHYNVLRDRRWYAAVVIVAPIGFIFAVAWVIVLVTRLSIVESYLLIPSIVLAALIGIILTSFLCNALGSFQPASSGEPIQGS